MKSIAVAVGIGFFALGCVGSDTVSNYARPGDTVIVAMGGDRQGIFSRDDLVAELTDSAGVTVDVRIRNVTQVYADPTSRVGGPTGSSVSYEGMRVAIVDLITPASDPTASSFVRVNVVPGPARLNLWTTDNVNVARDVRLEILSDDPNNPTGAPNPLTENILGGSYVDGLRLRPQLRFALSPTSNAYTAVVGSAEVTIRYPTSAASGLAATHVPQAIHTELDQHLQFLTGNSTDGSDNVIKVVMVNPFGIKKGNTNPAALFYQGMSPYWGMRFAVAWGQVGVATSYGPEPAFDRSVIETAATSFVVYDIDGADVTSNFKLTVQ